MSYALLKLDENGFFFLKGVVWAYQEVQKIAGDPGPHTSRPCALRMRPGASQKSAAHDIALYNLISALYAMDATYKQL